ncbi:hypothetical protein DW916_17110 [Segatella copri]|uniref:Lipocalin-like domain-containing protein n=2 Tax=Segatella copri TaxID=165179 RepID=A0AA92WGZ9_9BACT|nr:hypothetical protein DW916_17110 [Segatella copri]
MVAAMIAFPALVNAQQSLYFGGAPNWNQIQMKTAEGKDVPYIATGQYAAWVLLSDEAQKISTSEYKGVKLEYENHQAGEKNALMLVNVIPEGETEWGDQQHTQVPEGDHEGDQAVTVNFDDVVKDKTIKELRLWAPEKGIQILLKKVWLIKNDNTLEEQKFSLLWGGWNWSKPVQAAPQLTFPVQYCGQFVCDSEAGNLATYSALSNETQEYHLELKEALTNPVAILPNWVYKETINGKEETKEGTFDYSLFVPAGKTEYTFTLDRDKVTGWANKQDKAPVVDKIIFQNNEEIKTPFTMYIKSLTRTSILNMPSSGFATFCASYPVNYGSLNFEAYAVKLDADKKTITLKKIEGVVPAGKAVLLKGTPSKSYRLTTGEGAVAEFDTDLKVSDGSATSSDAVAVYGLATVKGQDGFYKASAGKTIPAKCAYLEVANSTSPAKFYSLGDHSGSTTGITSVKNEAAGNNAPMYNLAGQLVDKGYKGIVIKNGKKIVLK